MRGQVRIKKSDSHIESGSNSNGNWIKYGDGTMIQSGIKDFTTNVTTSGFNGYTQIIGITFPTNFIDTDYSINVISKFIISWFPRFQSTPAVGSISMYAWRAGTDTGNLDTYRWQAIGRWK